MLGTALGGGTCDIDRLLRDQYHLGPLLHPTSQMQVAAGKNRLPNVPWKAMCFAYVSIKYWLVLEAGSD
jgi:hypothetical protein